MQDEPESLFAIPDGPKTLSHAVTYEPPAIRDDQVAELRSAFDAAGITDQAERKQVVQSAVPRPIVSLRELRATDVRHVLARIVARGTASARMGSDWDQRGEDTWIDRL